LVATSEVVFGVAERRHPKSFGRASFGRLTAMRAKLWRKSGRAFNAASRLRRIPDVNANHGMTNSRQPAKFDCGE
jgi:hypothetical protein